MKNNIGQDIENEFFAEVAKLPCIEILPDGYATLSYNSHAIVVQILSTPEDEGSIPLVANFCSEGYGLISTSEIFKPLEEMLDRRYIYDYKREMSQYSKFYVDYIIKKSDDSDDPTFASIGSDKFTPVIKICHSYSGRFSYWVIFGAYRSNGSFVYGTIYEGEISFVHSEGNIDDLFEQTMEQTEDYLDNFSLTLAELKALKGKAITFEGEGLVEFVEEQLKEANFFISLKEDILIRYKQEAAINGPNLYSFYMACNYELNFNPKLTTAIENKIKADKRLFNYLIK